MRGKRNSRHRQIDAAAKAAFLAGLREGPRREDAAAAAGFSLMGFYNARARDPRPLSLEVRGKGSQSESG
jgi:hypothetical protein